MAATLANTIALLGCLLAPSTQPASTPLDVPTVVAVRKASSGHYEFKVDSRPVTGMRGQSLLDLLRAAQAQSAVPRSIVVLVDHEVVSSDLWGISRELSPVTSSRQSVRYFVTNGATMFEVMLKPEGYSEQTLGANLQRSQRPLVISVEKTAVGRAYVIDGMESRVSGPQALAAVTSARREHSANHSTIVLIDYRLQMKDMSSVLLELGLNDAGRVTTRYFATNWKNHSFAAGWKEGFEIIFGSPIKHSTNPGGE